VSSAAVIATTVAIAASISLIGRAETCRVLRVRAL